jgi:tRNA-modifying protein YgfZ
MRARGRTTSSGRESSDGAEAAAERGAGAGRELADETGAGAEAGAVTKRELADETGAGAEAGAADPAGHAAAAYSAAVGDGAFFPRPDRVLLLVEGRSPARMLTGIASGAMPPDPAESGSAAGEAGSTRIRKGRAPYSAILTPKGKLVTDLRIVRLEAGESGALLLDVPRTGLEGLLAHLKRFLPPRLAKLVDPPEPLGLLTVTGRKAPAVLSREGFGLRLGAEELEALAEGEERVADDGSRTGLRVIRNGEVHPPAFDILAPEAVLHTLGERLRALGVPRADPGVLETLRMEKGRPRYGVELDPDTLPPEAGIHERAIDHTKGCYTGQEVIVRIRDRGRVNRHLRGLLLGGTLGASTRGRESSGPRAKPPAPPGEARVSPAAASALPAAAASTLPAGDSTLPAAAAPTLPAPGTPLFIEGRDRPAGEVRSATVSPRFGQLIALGYLRREAEPPTIARLGAPDGPEVQVRALGDEGWELVPGDPGGG